MLTCPTIASFVTVSVTFTRDWLIQLRASKTILESINLHGIVNIAVCIYSVSDQILMQKSFNFIKVYIYNCTCVLLTHEFIGQNWITNTLDRLKLLTVFAYILIEMSTGFIPIDHQIPVFY